MLLINLKNIEEIIFSNQEIKKLLPDLQHIFDQWTLGRRMSVLRSMKTQALLDMLNNLNKEHIKVLEIYFNDKISLDKLDYHIVKNIQLDLDFDPDKEFADLGEFSNFTISRNKDKVSFSFWR